jgi:hypothetical protein
VDIETGRGIKEFSEFYLDIAVPSDGISDLMGEPNTKLVYLFLS